jgi:hypothetical protein
MSTNTGELVKNLGEDAKVSESFVAGQPELVQRATDPLILPQPYSQPTDFTAQYPVPLDTTELIDKCEEVNMLRAIPELPFSLNAYTWREMDVLSMYSGTTADANYIAFADGECPEEYDHTGDNYTVYMKNIGAKKTLSIRDIKHSTAIAAAGWNGINTLVGGLPSSEGLPGGSDMASFQREVVRGAKEKEVRLAMTLVMNGEDRLLVQGDATTRTLEFDGIENYFKNTSCVMHTGSTTAGSGTFSASSFDQFLAESCAKPTHIFGHPAAIQEMMSAYFQLGFAGSQIVNYNDGNRIVPGFNFAGFVNTGVGRLMVVADYNFRRTNIDGSAFQADLWALRMTHNGEPLVYRYTQIPLSLTDLAPGCTAISFEVWKATALIIKMCCAQSKYTAAFTGKIVTTCGRLG